MKWLTSWNLLISLALIMVEIFFLLLWTRIRHLFSDWPLDWEAVDWVSPLALSFFSLTSFGSNLFIVIYSEPPFVWFDWNNFVISLKNWLIKTFLVKICQKSVLDNDLPFRCFQSTFCRNLVQKWSQNVIKMWLKSD